MRPLSAERVRSRYRARADEYTHSLGSIEAMAGEDRRLIAEWAATIQGPVLDAGSGPGHWTAFVGEHGVDVEGIDLVPEFVREESVRFPHLRFRVGDLESLPLEESSFGGILSWYSVIHTEPERMPLILGELARVLRPGGTLLLGFFAGQEIEPFDHAVVTAWFWPIAAMKDELVRAGFEVVETHSRTDEGRRPHGFAGALTLDFGHADSSMVLGKRGSRGWLGRTTRMSSGSGLSICSSPRRARR